MAKKPTLRPYDTTAQSRWATDIIFHGWSMSVFQA
jgi:hypothetical protein